MIYINILLFFIFTFYNNSNNNDDINLRGATQPFRFKVCFLEIISSSLTNLRTIGGLHGR